MLSPENSNVKFNIAFDQFQLADVLRETDPSKRTVDDVKKAAEDLETAIEYIPFHSKTTNIVHFPS